VTISILIGLIVGLIGFGIHWAVEAILEAKFRLVQSIVSDGAVGLAFVTYAGVNAALALSCTLLVVYLAVRTPPLSRALPSYWSVLTSPVRAHRRSPSCLCCWLCASL
jgi:hypothetical protein